MSGSRRNARGESTLRSILKETAQLVSQYGFDATTISRITKATGKPASSLYWFFETKDELVAAALEATYGRRPEEISGWPAYDADRILLEQLEEIMLEQLRSSVTERPVRLGLMVALEGSAASSIVQNPLRSRRKIVRVMNREWWEELAALYGFGDPRGVATGMMRMTVAFLDGHYISDTQSTTVQLELKARFVAGCLYGAFLEMGKGVDILHAGSVAVQRDAHDVGAPGSDDFLLHATRRLVSERGYEGATLARICEDSGMQRSSVYWRYKDKSRLVEAAVAGPFLEIMRFGQVSEQVAVTRPADELAEVLLRCVYAAVEARDTVRSGLLMKLQHREPPVAASEKIQDGLAGQERLLRDWLMNSGELSADMASAAAWAVSVLTEGLMLAIAFGQEYDGAGLNRIAEAMFDTALQISTESVSNA